MKTLFPLLVAAALLGTAACSKPESHHPGRADDLPEGVISFSLSPDEGQVSLTRAATAYTTAQPYETRVNKVQVFVFNADGRLAAYKDNGTSLTGTVATTAGEKTVWAVVNGPDLSSVTTLQGLRESAVDLSANLTDPAAGFVMSGSGTCTVTGTGESGCDFHVSRLAARVALVGVENRLPASYGSLRVERVFLCNVVGNQNVAGDAAPATWYNQDGRKDESPRSASHIIDGSTYRASCESLTYRSVGESVANGGSHAPSTPYLFYAYPNDSAVTPDGFSNPFSPKRTLLTVAATVGGVLQYYPVVLSSGLERNCTYSVALTITGPGSDDPGRPVTKGSVSVTVAVDGWTSGAVYDETI